MDEWENDDKRLGNVKLNQVDIEEMDQAAARKKKQIAHRLVRDTQRQARIGAIDKQVLHSSI